MTMMKMTIMILSKIILFFLLKWGVPRRRTWRIWESMRMIIIKKTPKKKNTRTNPKKSTIKTDNPDNARGGGTRRQATMDGLLVPRTWMRKLQ